MGILANPKHERACQMLHKRICEGEDPVAARLSVYQEVIYSGDDPQGQSVIDNARKWINQKDIKKRLAEMQSRAALLADLDAGFALVELKKQLVEVKAWNLDDFLEERDGESQPDFDLSKVTRKQLGRLSALTIEHGKYGRKVGIKGPEKPTVIASLIGTMARIAGWEAPKKIAPTNPEGTESFKGSPHGLSDEELLAIALGARANQAA